MEPPFPVVHGWILASSKGAWALLGYGPRREVHTSLLGFLSQLEAPMPYHSRRIYHTTTRTRSYPPSACFTWPVFEQTTSDRMETIGEIIESSSKLPNWRQRCAKGLQATTTYIGWEKSIDYTPGYIDLDRWCPAAQAWATWSMEGDLFQGHSAPWTEPSTPTTVMNPIASDIALSRAVADARSKQNHFRGGNFLAELADTIRGLRNPVKGFRGLLDTYHRNARRRVKSAVGRRPIPVTQSDFRRLEKDSPDVARAAQRALSDSWLEANFGWSPLLGDAVDAYHALRRLSARTPLSRFYGAHSVVTGPTYDSNTRALDKYTLRFTVRISGEARVKYYGAVKLRVDEPTGTAIEEFGVRARDFLPAVWEAIPYSFLIDYFSNVGDIIEAVSFPRSDLAWMARTFRNHSTRSTERVAVTDDSPVFPLVLHSELKGWKPPRVTRTFAYHNRNGYAGSLIPGFRFEIPGSKNWRKWCNIAALGRLRSL